MTKEKIYLSIPMTGHPNENRELFEKYEEHFMAYGFDVVNPVRLEEELCKAHQDAGLPGPTYEQKLLYDLYRLTFCNYLALHPGFEK